LVETLREKFQMAYTGTLKPNRKGLPGDFKSLKGREDGDYFVLYDVTGKMSIHSWLNKKKSGECSDKWIFFSLIQAFSLSAVLIYLYWYSWVYIM
jgi:hypothetical protein